VPDRGDTVKIAKQPSLSGNILAKGGIGCVTAAKAAVQTGEGLVIWIPASAGMTRRLQTAGEEPNCFGRLTCYLFRGLLLIAQLAEFFFAQAVVMAQFVEDGDANLFT